MPRLLWTSLLSTVAAAGLWHHQSQWRGTFPESVDPVLLSVASCTAEADGLSVIWEGTTLADYYELQLALGPDSQTIAAVSTSRTTALVRDALPNVTYYLRLRAHRSGTPSLGPGTWGPTGPATECSTPGGWPRQPPGGWSRSPSAAASSGRSPTMLLEMMRESEFTYDVDYLMNHNAGNVHGDVAFLTMGSKPPNETSFLNVTFGNGTFSFFCVEVLHVTIPNTTTPLGNDSFADYLSCNDNGNPRDPQCGCDNWIDRKIGNLDPNISCKTAAGENCSWHGWFEHCSCSCSPQSLDVSGKYVGMMPVKFGNTEAFGQWYSLPAGAECAEDEAVGSRRPDGTQCTWRRRPAFRVVRGWDMLEAGWNITRSPGQLFPDAQQVLGNVGAVRHALASVPLAPWRCQQDEPASPVEFMV